MVQIEVAWRICKRERYPAIPRFMLLESVNPDDRLIAVQSQLEAGNDVSLRADYCDMRRATATIIRCLEDGLSRRTQSAIRHVIVVADPATEHIRIGSALVALS